MADRIEVDRIDVAEPRIPSVPIVRQIQPPVRPPKPVVQTIQPPVIGIPGYEPPSYDPPVYNPTPSGPGSGGGPQSPPRQPDYDAVDEYAGSLNIPANPFGGPREINQGTTVEILGRELPVPTQKEVTLAGTTAMASVAAALLGKSIVMQLVKIMKPVFKQGYLKAKKAMGKDLSVQEAQLYFAFEHGGLKRVLKSEQEADLMEQQQLHQRRWQHTGSLDETSHLHDEPHHNE